MNEMNECHNNNSGETMTTNSISSFARDVSLVSRGQKIDILLLYLKVTFVQGYDNLGCWHLPENDTAAVASLEGHHYGLEGFYWDR